MNSYPSRPSYASTLFLILLACYGYFFPKWDDSDWVANSRADLVYAIGDEGVMYIDDYHINTGDKAFFEGHYYTVGSIGPSLVALPFYMIFKGIAAILPLKDFLESDRVIVHFENRLNPESEPISFNFGYQNLALAFITFFAISIPSAMLGTILFLFAARFTHEDSYAFILALVYGLGTIAFPYSRALFQHQIAAFGAFVGFVLLWRVIYEDADFKWLWVVGLLFGLAAISEYPVIPFLSLIFLWAIYKRSIRPQLYRVVLGALPLLLILMAYDLAAFNTPLPVGYRYHVIHREVHRQGLMGVTIPSLEALYGLTISPFRGLFFISPILILAIPGLYFMWRQKDQGIAVLLTCIIAGFFLYNASYLFWWGGYAVGPRYLVPMLPFMILSISLTFNRWLDCLTGRIIIGLLIMLSLFNVWAQTITGQYYPPVMSDGVPLSNPLIDYSIPLLLEGSIARNYGNILGLIGLPSLIPLLVAVSGIYLIVPYLFMQRARKYQSVDTMHLYILFLILLLAAVIGYSISCESQTQELFLVAQEIRYHMPEAGEVFLVWGINDWHIMPEETHLAETVVKEGVMHTPMVREDATFIAKGQVPSGVTIDYGFLMTKKHKGAAVEAGDANDDPKQDYHVVSVEGGVVEPQATLTLEGYRRRIIQEVFHGIIQEALL